MSSLHAFTYSSPEEVAARVLDKKNLDHAMSLRRTLVTGVEGNEVLINLVKALRREKRVSRNKRLSVLVGIVTEIVFYGNNINDIVRGDLGNQIVIGLTSETEVTLWEVNQIEISVPGQPSIWVEYRANSYRLSDRYAAKDSGRRAAFKDVPEFKGLPD